MYASSIMPRKTGKRGIWDTPSREEGRLNTSACRRFAFSSDTRSEMALRDKKSREAREHIHAPRQELAFFVW